MIRRLMSRFGYEKRSDSSYQEQLLTLLNSEVNGRQAVTTASGALEACTGLAGRTFAMAEITGPDYATAALTPDLMTLIGRELIRTGEVIFKVDVMDGRLRLWPATSYDIYGDRDPEQWRYRLDMAGPDIRITQEDVHANMAVHLQYAREVQRPWRGLGPLQVASIAGNLSARTAQSLADETGMPVGAFLPTIKDGTDPSLADIQRKMKQKQGRLHFVESMASAWQSGQVAPADWKANRYGPMPPDAMVNLLSAASREVFAACGMNPALFTSEGESSQRESWRQCLHGVIAPLGRLVEVELRRKLDSPDLSITWQELRASDIQGRARAFQSMVGAGMAIEKAAALSGLLLPDEEG